MAAVTGSTTSFCFIPIAIGRFTAFGPLSHDRVSSLTPLKGLSRMPGNTQVRFLRGGRRRKALLLPDFWLLSASKYASPYWLTLRQANELGGHVRQGEHSQIVVFWKIDRVADDVEVEPEVENFEMAKSSRRFVLRYYRAWNLEQCELPKVVHDRLPQSETHQHDPIEAAERIIVGMPNPPEIQYAGAQAFYSPMTDRITLPPRESFLGAAELYATAFHEICHYADCRIMPRFSRRPLRLMGHGREMSA